MNKEARNEAAQKMQHAWRLRRSAKSVAEGGRPFATLVSEFLITQADRLMREAEERMVKPDSQTSENGPEES